MSSHEKDRRRLSKSSIHPTKENRSRKSRQVPSFDAASNATPTADEAVNTQAHNDGFFNTASEDSYPETNSLPVIHHHQMATSSNIVPEDSQWPAPLLGPSTYPPTQPPLPGLAPDPRIYYPAGDDLDYPNQVGSPSSVAVDQGSVEKCDSVIVLQTAFTNAITAHPRQWPTMLNLDRHIRLLILEHDKRRDIETKGDLVGVIPTIILQIKELTRELLRHETLSKTVEGHTSPLSPRARIETTVCSVMLMCCLMWKISPIELGNMIPVIDNSAAARICSRATLASLLRLKSINL